MNRIIRPWGWYEEILNNDGYKVKRLFVGINQKISLQYHNYRCEHWIVVEGFGKVELSETIREVKVGDHIFVPIHQKHRIYGGEYGIMIIEVQLGSHCLEEDIVRIKDDYGRI